MPRVRLMRRFLWLLLGGVLPAFSFREAAAGEKFADGVSDPGLARENFLTVRGDYLPFIKPEVSRPLMAKRWFREAFVPGVQEKGDWTTTSNLGMQEAIVSILLPFLKNCSRSVIDVGAGTGSLVLLLAEFASNVTEVVGLEYKSEITEACRDRMESVEELGGQYEDVASRITFVTGDAFQMTERAKYGVMNVGFAMTAIHPRLWAALAPGGVLGMPVCKAPDSVLPSDTHCRSEYRVFQKLNHEVPNAEHPTTRIDKELKFIVVRPPDPNNG